MFIYANLNTFAETLLNMLTDFEGLVPIVDDNSVEFYVHHAKIHKFETALHVHNKAQLIYAEGGIVHIFIHEKHWYLPARCYMWIPANEPHSILSYSNNIELYNFYFHSEIHEASFYQKTNIYFADDMLREMIVFTKKWDGSINPEQKSAFHFLQAIKSILPELVKNELPFSVQHPFPKDEKLVEIAAFLLQHIDKSYTIEEIAKKFGISVRTLSRKFKEQIGMNYIRFLRSLRIIKSLELIAENKYNLFEISMMVGYSSISSFSTVFLKVTGIRPSDYGKIVHK